MLVGAHLLLCFSPQVFIGKGTYLNRGTESKIKNKIKTDSWGSTILRRNLTGGRMLYHIVLNKAVNIDANRPFNFCQE